MKRAFTVAVAALCLTGLLAAPSRASAVYHLSPSGSDSNPGTADQPWGTFLKSLPKLHAGDTLVVHGGRYVENATSMVLHPGTSAAKIRVVAATGDEPVIEGLFWLREPTYWRINNIDVTWHQGNPSTAHMVRIANGSYWTYKNSEIWGAESFAGMNVYSTVPGQPSSFKIVRNCIHDTKPSNAINQDHLMYVNPSTEGSGGVIRNNVLFDAANGSGVKLAGPDTSSGPGHVEVERNTIYDTARSVLVGGRANHSNIHNNILAHAINGQPIRGYQLTGDDNVAHDNLWVDSDPLIYSDPGFKEVQDGGGNKKVDTLRFDSISCNGFDPLSPVGPRFGASL